MQGVSIRFVNRKAHQVTLEGCSSDTEKDENIDDEKLVIAHHDAIVQFGERNDCLGLLRDKEENEWYENSKDGDKDGWKERLQEFLLPWVVVEVVRLDRQNLAARE